MLDYLRLMNPLWIFQRIASYVKVRRARALGSSAPVEIRLYGQKITLRPHGPDFRVAVSTLGSEFDPLIGIFPKLFSGVIVDAGGFIGTSALRMSQIYPEAEIVVIEPSDKNFRILERNVKSFSKIHPVHAALVPDGEKKYVLYDRGTGAWGFTIVDSPEDKRNAAMLHNVETITLEQISQMFGGSRISIVKLDIEGGEKFLFDAADPCLLNAEVIFVELHDRIVSGCTESFLKFSSDRVVFKPGREKYLAIKRF